jgi:hypothetical protein
MVHQEPLDLLDLQVHQVHQELAEHQDLLERAEHQDLLEVVDLVDKAVRQVVQGLVDPPVSLELLVLPVVRDRPGNQEQ